MIAEVEKPDGSYEKIEMMPPAHVYCDNCGDCIICSGGCYCEWNQWVIYLFDPLNPFHGEKRIQQAVKGEN